ncbi:MAG TPA: hypothetical protein VNM92_07460 [Thermoanaerobaculia bacterium]|nr:hypothetical protein [Thermoanaerobaculia bacterium]
MEPPRGDGSETPLVVGATGGTVRYNIASSGQWTIYAGTDDLFGSGDYLVSVSCDNTASVPVSVSCAPQDLLCGQTSEWSLTARSCRFSDGRPYERYGIYMVQGDVVVIEMTSFAFKPLFGLYKSPTDTLVTSMPLRNGTVNAVFSVPTTGYYTILATPNETTNISGDFRLKVSCSLSGCLAPKIIQQPQGSAVGYGQRATLSVNTHQVGRSTTTEWYRRSEDLNADFRVGTGNTFLTPALTGTASYYAAVKNDCGQDVSNPHFSR